MKKFILLVLMSLFAIPLAVVAQDSQAFYKEELKKQGWLYGCAPPNWSLIEPLRGGFNIAVIQGRTDIMDLEIKAGLNPVDCGNEAVYVATMHNRAKVLDMLLKNGFLPDTIFIDHSFLTFAIYRKNVECVKVLIDNGADVNFVARKKHPLNSAIKKNNAEIVKMLVDAGAIPNDETKRLVEKSRNQEIKSLFTE